MDDTNQNSYFVENSSANNINQNGYFVEGISTPVDTPKPKQKDIKKLCIIAGSVLVGIIVICTLVFLIIKANSGTDENGEDLKNVPTRKIYLNMDSEDAKSVISAVDHMPLAISSYFGDGEEDEYYTFSYNDMSYNEKMSAVFLSSCTSTEEVVTNEMINDRAKAFLRGETINIDDIITNMGDEFDYTIRARKADGGLVFYDGCEIPQYGKDVIVHNVSNVFYDGGSQYYAIAEWGFGLLTEVSDPGSEHGDMLVDYYSKYDYSGPVLQTTSNPSTLNWNKFNQYRYTFTKVDGGFRFDKFELIRDFTK